MKRVIKLEDEIKQLQISQASFQAAMTKEVESIRRNITTIAEKLTALVDIRDQVHDNKRDIKQLSKDLAFIKKIIYTIAMFMTLAIFGALLRLVILQ